jgi:hypothetical protein
MTFRQSSENSNIFEVADPATGESVVFHTEQKGFGDYSVVAHGIRETGLKCPSFGQALLLAHAVWKEPDHEPFASIIEAMQRRWLWTDTALLYVPGKGVYVRDHPRLNPVEEPLLTEMSGKGIHFDEEELEAELEKKNPDVRLVPFGFRAGEMDAEDLIEHPVIVGLAGSRQRTALLVELASHYPQKPFLNCFENVEKTAARVACLGASYLGEQLMISCVCYDLGPNGNGMCGFGIE